MQEVTSAISVGAQGSKLERDVEESLESDC